jgi:acyl-CoA hydrolase
MENYKLVLRGDLNQNGYLFGGKLLKWVDEYAWIAASLEHPDCNFVTIALDNVVFKKSIGEGSILKFEINPEKTGKTSICYRVNVFCRRDCQEKLTAVFSTHVTFVNIDTNGEKAPIR